MSGPFKPVGVDSDSLFPTRVETRLAGKFVPKGSLVRNVLDYGADPTGTTDSSAAFQAAINALTAGGTVFAPPGTYIINTSLTWPIGKVISLRGSGKGVSGGVYATQLKRTAGTAPIIAAAGNPTNSSQRVMPELSNMEISGVTGQTGDLVSIYRASHFELDNVRIARTSGTGLHGTELWDSAINRLILETCGADTTAPALLFDSIVGGGANANCATVHISNSVFQGNAGTDIKLTGSTADSSPCNDVQFVNIKMEAGTGTHPGIDLDYAQHVSFVNGKFICTQTATGFVIQTNTTGTSAVGARTNRFIGCTFDGGGSFQYWFDVAANTMDVIAPNFVTTPVVSDIRIQSTVSAGRFKFIGNAPHGITDSRTTDEHLGDSLANLNASDVALYRTGIGELTLGGIVPVSTGNLGFGRLLIKGRDGGGPGLEQIVVTTGDAATNRTGFILFNGRARFGYDGGFAAPTMDDGNAGANKPLYFRNSGSAHSIMQTNGDLEVARGNISAMTLGKGVKVKEGAGAKQGVATLAAGTVTVANTNVTASSRILLTGQDNNVVGALRVSARTAGTGFTITSSVGTDSGVVAWFISEPA
jgi:hypothetical protein